jgi:hypothetical protein
MMAGEDDYKSPMEDAEGVVGVESNLIKRKVSFSWCDVTYSASEPVKIPPSLPSITYYNYKKDDTETTIFAL